MLEMNEQIETLVWQCCSPSCSLPSAYRFTGNLYAYSHKPRAQIYKPVLWQNCRYWHTVKTVRSNLFTDSTYENSAGLHGRIAARAVHYQILYRSVCTKPALTLDLIWRFIHSLLQRSYVQRKNVLMPWLCYVFSWSFLCLIFRLPRHNILLSVLISVYYSCLLII